MNFSSWRRLLDLVPSILAWVIVGAGSLPGQTGDALAPRTTISVHHTLTIAGPGSRRIGIRSHYTGITRPDLDLALFESSVPGLESILTFYRAEPRFFVIDVTSKAPREITDQVRSDRSRQQGPFRLITYSIGATRGMESSAAAPKDLDQVLVTYDLDLSRFGTLDPRTASQYYSGMTWIGERVGVLRGEVLTFPLSSSLSVTEGQGPPEFFVSPSVSIEVPTGWRRILPGVPGAGSVETPQVFPAESSVRSVTWLGLVGEDILAESVSPPGRTDPTWQIFIPRTASGGQADAATMARVIRDRVLHYANVFGTEPLKYLVIPPPQGTGVTELTIFAIPSPLEGSGTGGQCTFGSVRFLYGNDSEVAGHVMAHEIFHTYNSSALRLNRGPREPELTWFTEGYTDLQAVLCNLSLDPGLSTKDRVERFKRVMRRDWASMARLEPSQRDEVDAYLNGGAGLPDFARPDADFGLEKYGPLGTLRLASIFADGDAYYPLIQGRANLLVLRLGTLLGAAGTRKWFEDLLRAYPSGNPYEPSSPSGPGLDHAALRESAIAAAGTRGEEVRIFMQRFLDGTEPVSLQLLKEWLADERIEELVASP